MSVAVLRDTARRLAVCPNVRLQRFSSFRHRYSDDVETHCHVRQPDAAAPVEHRRGLGHVTACDPPGRRGTSRRVALLVPAAPMGRHCCDSLCLGEQVPGSIPPVSSTCVLSVSVVRTLPIVIVTVGATVTGVQVLGYPLVSKLS